MASVPIDRFAAIVRHRDGMSVFLQKAAGEALIYDVILSEQDLHGARAARDPPRLGMGHRDLRFRVARGRLEAASQLRHCYRLDQILLDAKPATPLFVVG